MPMPMPNPEPIDDPLAFQVLNEVGIINQLAQKRGEQLLGPTLNLPQFVVLNHLTLRGGGQSLVKMANAIQVTKGAMTNTVSRLQAKGWLDVQPDPADGRGKCVSLTATGHQARREAVQRLGIGLAQISQAVPLTDLAAALPVLRRLRVWLDANR